MKLTPLELLAKLPSNKDHWLVGDIAKAYDITRRAVQLAAKRSGTGTKVRKGPHGTLVFQEHDLVRLCAAIHAEVGNPVNMAKCRSKAVCP